MSTNSLADSLFERLHQAFPADQAYTPADWTDDAMPGPVRHYLKHLLRHHRRQEERYLRRARTDWVRYDHPDMEHVTRTYLDRMEDHLQVPQDQWTDTLQTAIRRTTEYLVRPVSTLTTFVFEDASAAVPVDHIQWRMRFFGPYAYLRNAVEAFAEKRNRDAFEQDEVERILRRVDERMTADFDVDRWLRLLDPLFETAQHANGHEQIPLPLLRTFFEEKNASDILDQLTDYDSEHCEVAVSPATLQELLESTSAAPPTDQPDVPPAPSASSPDLREPPEDGSASDPEPTAPDDASDEPTPMWKQFQFEQDRSRRRTDPENDQTEDSQPLWTQFATRKSSSGPDYDSTSPSSPSEPSSGSESPSEPEPLSGSEPSPADPARNTTLTALEREVFGSESAPNRTVYVRELFQGDGEAYREVLERLRRTDTWNEASQIIARDVFRTHQVNIYSDAAVHFTDAVEAGFKEE